jgi:GAF domain-containing protein
MMRQWPDEHSDAMTVASPEPGDSTTSQDGMTFAELALELHEAADADETIERILDYSQSSLAGDDAGVLLIHARGRLEVVASTSDDVTKAHLLQVELDEGPCLDAAEDPTAIYRVDDTATDPRWPRWCAEVIQLGFRSILAVPLATRTRRYGSLNIYARRPHAFSEADDEVAMILARHASVALATSHNIDGLRRAVDARKLIGIAMGLLMARYDLESQQAFNVLSRYSQAQNVKLRDVAERVISERGLPTEEAG